MGNNSKMEQEKRRERLKIFSNKNQWLKKRDIEQAIEEMSAQIREYRRDLQCIRMQEEATEAKIEKLQHQIQNLEQAVYGEKKPSAIQKQTSDKIADFYDHNMEKWEQYSLSYRENGMEQTENKSTFHMYA